jgi:hypothetical protein
VPSSPYVEEARRSVKIPLDGAPVGTTRITMTWHVPSASRALVMLDDVAVGNQQRPAIIYVRVTGSPKDAQFVKSILKARFPEHGFEVVSCIDDLALEGEIARVAAERGIRNTADHPAAAEILRQARQKGCLPVLIKPLIVDASVHLNAVTKRHSLHVDLRNPGRPNEDRSFDFKTDDGWQEAVEGILKKITPKDELQPPPPPPPPQLPAPSHRNTTPSRIASVVGWTGLAVSGAGGIGLLILRHRLDTGDCNREHQCGPGESTRLAVYNALRPVTTASLIVSGAGFVTSLGLRRWLAPAASIGLIPHPFGATAVLSGLF